MSNRYLLKQSILQHSGIPTVSIYNKFYFYFNFAIVLKRKKNLILYWTKNYNVNRKFDFVQNIWAGHKDVAWTHSGPPLELHPNIWYTRKVMCWHQKHMYFGNSQTTQNFGLKLEDHTEVQFYLNNPDTTVFLRFTFENIYVAKDITRFHLYL